ncbi:DUF3558 domain-containing protein [Nocardia amamiensis]|uniref:DUF3558 domain-containing protein n=1 Tax=Nocardia TaxID=1817 RepID=UPI0033E5AE0C
MRPITGAVLAAGLLVAGLALTGCDSADGDPQPTTTTAAAALFNPCTGIPDDALRGAGVDPATEETGIGGVQQAGWEICAWKGSRYSISIYSTSKLPAEIANKPGNTGQRDATIAGRTGTEFRSQGWDRQCNIVFPAEQGVVQLQVLGRLSETNPEDPCATLSRVGEAVVPSLPK